jgi:DNA-nicking Smr family endonuclease
MVQSVERLVYTPGWDRCGTAPDVAREYTIMARNKRRQSRPSRRTSQKERFHTPFDELQTVLREVSRPPPPPVTPSPVSPNPSAPVTAEVQAQRERALFLAEMAGVKPLPQDPRGRVEKHRRSRTPGLDPSEELRALADLQELVDGRGEFTIQYTDEYMEGVAPGVDRGLAQRLHRGDYAVQGHLDLHGYTVEEAKGLVDRFLIQAYTSGRRCVRMVHGRGRNSRDNRPVLKEQVQLWLSHGRLSRLVLAFATAPAVDGGAGAVYVLLRRGPSATPRK